MCFLFLLKWHHLLLVCVCWIKRICNENSRILPFIHECTRVKPLFPRPTHLYTHKISEYALSKSSLKISCHLRIEQNNTHHYLLVAWHYSTLEISGLTLVPSGFRVNKFSVLISSVFQLASKQWYFTVLWWTYATMCFHWISENQFFNSIELSYGYLNHLPVAFHLVILIFENFAAEIPEQIQSNFRLVLRAYSSYFSLYILMKKVPNRKGR